jgi:hypothetical protein
MDVVAQELERALQYAQNTVARLRMMVPCPRCVDRILHNDTVNSVAFGLFEYRELQRNMGRNSIQNCDTIRSHAASTEEILFQFFRRNPPPRPLACKDQEPSREELTFAVMTLSVFLHVAGIATIRGKIGEGTITGRRSNGDGIDKKTWLKAIALKAPLRRAVLEAFCNHLVAEFTIIRDIGREAGAPTKSRDGRLSQAVLAAAKSLKQDSTAFLKRWDDNNPYKRRKLRTDWGNPAYLEDTAYDFIRAIGSGQFH